MSADCCKLIVKSFFGIRILKFDVMLTENKYDYDLEERTALFGESIIEFAKSLRKDTINRELIKQIVR